MKTETVIMPKELTSENGAKALLSGEFYSEIVIECPDCDGGEYQELETDQCGTCNNSGTITQRIPVSWTTIKDIYRMAVEHLANQPKQK